MFETALVSSLPILSRVTLSDFTVSCVVRSKTDTRTDNKIKTHINGKTQRGLRSLYSLNKDIVKAFSRRSVDIAAQTEISFKYLTLNTSLKMLISQR